MQTRPPLRRMRVIEHQLSLGSFPTLVELAAELEVHSRTVERDFEFMRDQLGAPIRYCVERRGYFLEDETWTLPAVRVTADELLALLVAEQSLSAIPSGRLSADLEQLVRRLGQMLPDELTVRLGEMGDLLSVRPTSLSALDEEHFTCLSQAVTNRRRVEVCYWTAERDAESTRVVDPWHLALVDGAWYLIGHCHMRDETRMFALSRVRSVAILNLPCEGADDFDAETYLAGGFRAVLGDGEPVAVRLRFDPEVARWIGERTWHHSQRATALPDGSLDLTLTVTDLREVRRWVLQWGAGVEVLAPDELRIAIRDEAHVLLERHKSNA